MDEFTSNPSVVPFPRSIDYREARELFKHLHAHRDISFRYNSNTTEKTFRRNGQAHAELVSRHVTGSFSRQGYDRLEEFALENDVTSTDRYTMLHIQFGRSLRDCSPETLELCRDLHKGIREYFSQ